MWTQPTCQRRRFTPNKNNNMKTSPSSGVGSVLRSISSIKHRKSRPSSVSSSSRSASTDVSQSFISMPSVLSKKSSLSSTLISVSVALAKNSDFCRNLVVAFVIVLCYNNSVTGDFVHDDIPAVVENPDVLGTRSFVELFGNDFWGMHMSNSASHKSYRPITTITFRWNLLLSTSDYPTLSFHIVNLFLHFIIEFMLGSVCKNILQLDNRSTFFVCLLHTVHPINVEAVASIIGRADLLCALFSLASLLAFNKAIASNKNCSQSHLLFSIVCSVLALGSKETGLTSLVLCALLWFHKRASNRSLPLQPLFSVLLSLIILVFARIWILAGELPIFAEQDNPAAFAPKLLTRALTYLYLAAFNTGLLLYPLKQSYDWQTGSIPLVKTVYDCRNVASTALLLTVSLLVIKAIRDLRDTAKQDLSASSISSSFQNNASQHFISASLSSSSSLSSLKIVKASLNSNNPSHVPSESCLTLLLGLGLIVVPYIPASNALVTVGFVVAERLLYIPSIGLVLLVVAGVRRLLSTRNWHIWLACLAMIFAAKCSQQSRTWSSRQSLYESGIRSVPENAKAHYNYANLLQSNRNWNSAIEHYNTAIRLWPEHASAHNNLGALHWRLSQLDAAEEHFKSAIRINPNHSKAYFNLGKVLNKRGQLKEAASFLERSLRLEPHFGEAYEALANVQSRLGRHLLAERLFQRAIQLWPRNADFHHNYATFLQRSGRSHSAVWHYFRAVHLRPSHRVALVNVAALCSSLQRYGSAEICYKRALKLNFDLVTLDQLGVLYLKQQRLRSARRVYEHILVKTGALKSTGFVDGGGVNMAGNADLNQLPLRIAGHYSQLLILEGRYEEAEQLLQKITASPISFSTTTSPELRPASGAKFSSNIIESYASFEPEVDSAQSNHADLANNNDKRDSASLAAIRADVDHQLAALYALTNRTDEALSSLGRALHWCEVSPQSTENAKLCSRLWVFSGDIRKDRGELQWALSSYSRAIILDECSVHAHINAAAIYHLKAEFTRALKHYAIAHQLAYTDEHHSLIRYNVAKLKKQIDKQHQHSSHHEHHHHDRHRQQHTSTSVSFVSLCNETKHDFTDETEFKFNDYSVAISGLRCQLDAVSGHSFIRYV